MNENRFYVYLHKIKETGEVFYVGKGTGDRINARNSRSKIWHEITENNEWVFEKYQDDLNEDEALRIECSLIESFSPRANVLKGARKRIKINTEYILSAYKYDENSYSCLSYINGNNTAGTSKRYPGDPVGRKTKRGYFRVYNGEDNCLVFAHRVVWFLCHGEDPGEFVIDHIDGNPSNNKISNLRKVTLQQNSRNRKPSTNSKLGILGVSYHATGMYGASWRDMSGRRHRKCFSSKKLGHDVALTLAKICRKIHSKINNYSDGRGSDEGLNLQVLCKYSFDDLIWLLGISTKSENEINHLHHILSS